MEAPNLKFLPKNEYFFINIGLIILTGPGCNHRLRHERQQAAIEKVSH
jgi:hypothetical protein